jgi:tRNA dimethylallyltransferase
MTALNSYIDTVDPDKPVLIAGPTASGKSALALELATRQDRMIINADALQVYECWSVLTARPSIGDLDRARHVLYGHQPYDACYSVGTWLREVAELLISDPRPIITGGTGLYFSALTEGLTHIPPISTQTRERGNVLRVQNLQAMIATLKNIDPETATGLDLENPMRVQRAWEVLQETGRGLKSWQKDTPPPLIARDQAEALVLQAPAEQLERRIIRRFDWMLENGALGEVENMLPKWNQDLPSSRAIGAPELVAYVKGDLSLDDATTRSIIATRQYAKRQRTWFRNRLSLWKTLNLNMG